MTQPTHLGRYLITRQLAEGGMGAVYLADDPTLVRQVALKVIKPTLAQDLARALFRQEIKNLSHLNHAHIVTIFDAGEDDDRLFIAMEYVAGHTLRDELRKEGVLSPQRVLALLKPITDALHHAHGRNLLHGDLKPDNIMIGNDGQVKLLDFGVARALHHHADTGDSGFMGTPEYASPEQLNRQHLDRRADGYALAVLLHELLTGRRPRVTPSSEVLLHQAPIPAPSTPPPGHEALAAFFFHALHPNREHRPPNAQRFCDRLTQLLETGSLPQGFSFHYIAKPWPATVPWQTPEPIPVAEDTPTPIPWRLMLTAAPMVPALLFFTGLLAQRSRERMLGLPSLTYDYWNLAVEGFLAWVYLPVGGFSALIANFPALRLAAWLLLAVCALMIFACVTAPTRPRRALALLILSGLILFRGGDYYLPALMVARPDQTQTRVTAWTTPPREGHRLDNMVYEVHSWLTNPDPAHLADRRELAGLLFWFLAAYAAAVFALLRMGNKQCLVPRAILLLIFGLLFGLNLLKLPHAYAYAEWGLAYPETDPSDNFLEQLPDQDLIQQAKTAGDLRIFDVSEGGTPRTFWIMGGGLGQGRSYQLELSATSEGGFSKSPQRHVIPPVLEQD